MAKGLLSKSSTALRLNARVQARGLASSKLAAVVQRALEEGARNTGAGVPGPSLPALQDLTAAMPPQPVSMPLVRSSARDRSPQNRLFQAQFIRRELIARRAHILLLLHFMPEPLAGQAAVNELAGLYWERLRAQLEKPAPATDEEEREFAAEMKMRNDQIADIGTAAEERMCIDALGAMQRERGSEWWATHPAERLAVDRHLDAIFLARIGLRFLLEHYVACGEPTEGFAGILETRCSPVGRCRALAEETRAWMEKEHGCAPHIEVVGDPTQTFTFVPSHIRFIVGTLLRNSSVATLRHHHQRQNAGTLEAGVPLPPVKVIVAVSDDAVQIKLADEAGGIKRSSLINVWSYRSLQSSWWQPPDGLSLPIARLYCKYFGGSLDLVPIEGYGTDCYVVFNRLSHANSEQILPDPVTDPTRRDSDQQSDGLFDAQSRRMGK
jgi:pyruvate dehydrogenase kinase 2/3/4